MNDDKQALTGRVAVVTGGNRGIGAGIVREFARHGATVVCAARDRAAAAAVVDEVVADRGHRAVFHEVDVCSPDSVHELFAFVDARFGALDVVIANAGVSRPGPIEVLDPASWSDVIDTNLTGVFLTMRAAVPLLEKDGGGRMIVVSSVLGTRVVPGASAYCASKAAVEALTKVAALELAPKGITANCLSPGFIDAGMTRELMSNEQVWPRFCDKLAGGRLGSATEVAAAAVFLASGESSYVNGQVLGVDGGLHW